ncbi:Rrf2 family transcriptional regulator [Ktedonosporobacter rubrisoli]|uniref:Rrf2 family transcriptional regulator n=1 Tax=Ktedonosporobacter rubrisoli TaxID=2509675 RepID=A0A4P6JLT7_KTERU|nr:Rrf2 family transcriptional regulator [Ktedonosporobacter rubrisoli]QBD76227.1 Rrf2 family transcriptional regulator [Ktedonosporobacter rubrisoli]
MQFSIGVEYALHCLLNLVDLPPEVHVGVKDLATFEGISETYLSKVFTRLQKAGVVRSIPGVKGGYELARAANEITLWNVIEAIEGQAAIFQCQGIIKGCVLYREQQPPAEFFSGRCLIHSVMLQAEEQMRTFLRERTLLWLYEKREEIAPAQHLAATRQWFSDVLKLDS